MSRGPAPSDPYSPRGGGKGGASSKRGAAPSDPYSPRGNSKGGPDPSRAPAGAGTGLQASSVSSSTTGAPAPGQPWLPPTTDPFNTPLSSDTVITDSGPTLSSDIPGFHLDMKIGQATRVATVGELLKMLFNMDPTSLKSLQERLVEANYLDPKDTTTGLSNVTGAMDSRTLTAYESLLTDVYRYQASGKTDTTIDGMLKDKISAYQAGGGNTTTTSQVNLFNPLQAQSFLQGAATKLLGRDPNPGEIAGFVSALNAYQQQNPDLSTVTMSPDGEKQTVSDKAGITSLHGGDAAAENYLLNDQGGDVAQHSQNVAMQSLLSMLGVGAMPGMSGN